MKNILFSCMLLMHAFNYSMDPDELLFPESNPHFFPAVKVLNVYRLPISLEIPESLSSLFASVKIDEVPAYLIEAVQEIKKKKPEMSIGKKLLCLQEEPVDKKSYFSHLPGELLKYIYTILMKNNFEKKEYKISLNTFIRAMDYGIKGNIVPDITNKKKRVCLFTGKKSMKHCCKLDDMLDAAETLKKYENFLILQENNVVKVSRFTNSISLREIENALIMLEIKREYELGEDLPVV